MCIVVFCMVQSITMLMIWLVLKKAVMQDRKALPRARDAQAARWEVLKMSKKFLYW